MSIEQADALEAATPRAHYTEGMERGDGTSSSHYTEGMERGDGTSSSHYVFATYSLTRFRPNPKRNQIITSSNNLDNLCRNAEAYIINVCRYGKRIGVCICKFDSSLPQNVLFPAAIETAEWATILQIHGPRTNFITTVSGAETLASEVLPRMHRIRPYLEWVTDLATSTTSELEVLYKQLFWKQPRQFLFKDYRMHSAIAKYRRPSMLGY